MAVRDKDEGVDFSFALRRHAGNERSAFAFRTSFVHLPVEKAYPVTPVNRNLTRSDRSKTGISIRLLAASSGAPATPRIPPRDCAAAGAFSVQVQASSPV